MARPLSVEARLDRLSALRLAPSAPEVREELAKGLASKTSLIASKAAQLAGELRRNDLTAELAAALEAFLANPGEDKYCTVATAAAKALVDAEIAAADNDAARRAFLAGVRHVQMVPRWDDPKDPDDAAAELRGLCAMGLVKTGYKDALLELTDLLSDRRPAARAGAARALGYTGREEAALLLRLKLAHREKHPDVAGEGLAAILRLSPPWAVQYAATFLNDTTSDVRAAAALALGESRKPDALEPLRGRLRQEAEPDVRKPLVLAVAMLRTPESREALLSIIATGKNSDAVEAVEALAIYRHDPSVRSQVEAAVNARKDAAAGQVFRAAFPAVPAAGADVTSPTA